jgi:hypothetical protein
MIEREEDQVSLETLGQGAALERFNLALQDVLDNIQDVNTDPKKARTVTLKATIKPSEDREVGSIVVDVVSKLAPIAPFDVRVFLGRDTEGKGYASEWKSPQQALALESESKETADNVYKLSKEAKG